MHSLSGNTYWFYGSFVSIVKTEYLDSTYHVRTSGYKAFVYAPNQTTIKVGSITDTLESYPMVFDTPEHARLHAFSVSRQISNGRPMLSQSNMSTIPNHFSR